MQILQSCKIKDESYQLEIAQILIAYNDSNPVTPAWSRTSSSILEEWRIHNVLSDFGFQPEHTDDVDLDNHDEGRGWIGFLWDRVLKP